jgi:hypothetical protein
MSESETNEMYMNGRGVMARTRELTDAMWDALPMSVLGNCGILFGVGGGVFLLWDAQTFLQGAGGFAGLGLAVLGYIAAKPWWTALSALRKHTEAMDAETEKRGRGWARS